MSEGPVAFFVVDSHVVIRLTKVIKKMLLKDSVQRLFSCYDFLISIVRRFLNLQGGCPLWTKWLSPFSLCWPFIKLLWKIKLAKKGSWQQFGNWRVLKETKILKENYNFPFYSTFVKYFFMYLALSKKVPLVVLQQKGVMNRILVLTIQCLVFITKENISNVQMVTLVISH